MRAVTCHAGELAVEELPAPTPGPGQVLIGVLRCGICGSDLHARHGSDEWAEMAVRTGYHHFARSSESIVYGHEFCGEIVAYGPGTRRRLPVGARVVALPMLRDPDGVQLTGLSARAPGAYAEQTLVQEALMSEVPAGLDTDVAALTEPLAVAWHAVRRSEIARRTPAVVIGCGPIGLAVVLMLRAHGVRTVIASDPSPARRELARACGATLVLDPTGEPGAPFAAIDSPRVVRDAASLFELGMRTSEQLTRLGRAWPAVWRLGDRLGAGPPSPVAFECVGVPGMIEQLIDGAPMYTRIVVVGVCVGADQITPAMAINKELDLRFAFGYSPLEFRDTLTMLAAGRVDPRPLLTGTVGLDGVAGAFDALGTPDRHAKILIDPREGVPNRPSHPS